MPGFVAVTGATGFIGQALIAALTNQDWHVRALTRQPQQNTERTTWVTGSLEDIPALNHLVDGAFAVIHCAGRVRGSCLNDFLDANAQGTINLVKVATEQATLPRFLLISSLAAREPGLSWYAESKYRGEQGLKTLSGPMPWAVFRPTAVYGPADRELTPLLSLTKYGILPVTISAQARFGLLYVDDLVAAILDWLKTEKPVTGVYELDDGTPGGYDQAAVATIASQVWKRPVYTFRLPPILIRFVSQVNLVLARLFHYSPMLTPAKVRELLHPDWVCDIRPLTRALGWLPVIDLNKGMHKAISPLNKTIS